MKRILVSAALLALGAGTAVAQVQSCAPRERVIQELANRWGEAQVWRGLARNGAFVLEVFANPETGTWTVFTTVPSGVSCQRASGTGFEVVPFEAPVESESL